MQMRVTMIPMLQKTMVLVQFWMSVVYAVEWESQKVLVTAMEMNLNLLTIAMATV